MTIRRLDLYQIDQHCPKCGEHDWTDTYCENTVGYSQWGHEVIHRIPVIHRHCRNCHFEMLALPLDTKDDADD